MTRKKTEVGRDRKKKDGRRSPSGPKEVKSRERQRAFHTAKFQDEKKKKEDIFVGGGGGWRGIVNLQMAEGPTKHLQRPNGSRRRTLSRNSKTE